MIKKDKAHLLRMTRAQLVEKLETLTKQNATNVANSSEIIENQKKFIVKLHKEIDALDIDKSQLEDTIDEMTCTIGELKYKVQNKKYSYIVSILISFLLGIGIGLVF